jgi:hypothetical protein
MRSNLCRKTSSHSTELMFLLMLWSLDLAFLLRITSPGIFPINSTALERMQRSCLVSTMPRVPDNKNPFLNSPKENWELCIFYFAFCSLVSIFDSLPFPCFPIVTFMVLH